MSPGRRPPALGPAVRLVRRDLRRQLRRHWLVVLLIALPVAIGAYVAMSQRTVLDDRLTEAQRDGLGSAEVIARLDPGYNRPTWGERETDLDRVVAALEAEAGARGGGVLVKRVWYDIGGPVPFDQLVIADWSSPLAAGAFAHVEGRLPAEVGEIAVSPDLADRLGVDIGHRLPTTGDSQLTVVGVVRSHLRQPWSPEVAYAVDHEGTWPPPMQATIGVTGIPLTQVRSIMGAGGFLDEPNVEPNDEAGSFWLTDGTEVVGQRRTDGVDGLVDPDNRPEQIGALITAGLLVESALLAAAAFVVQGRRRVVEIGRLAAIGADPRQIECMMLVEAVVVGAAGALLGVVTALGAAVGATGTLVEVGSAFASQPVDATSVRVIAGDLLLPALVAVAAAVVAAWVPARRAAGRSPRVSLAGGTPARPLRPRWVPLGGALMMGAGVALWVADRLDRTTSPGSLIALVAVFGLGLLLAAVLVLGAGVVDRLARIRRPLPLVLRLGLRHLGRNRTRAAVVIGSCAVVGALTVTATVLVAADRYEVDPDATMAVVYPPTGEYSVAWLDLGHRAVPSPGGGNRSEITQPVLAEVEAAVDPDHQVPLQSVVDPTGDPAWVIVPELARNGGLAFHGSVVVATPELVEALGLEPEIWAALAAPDTMVAVTGALSSVDGDAAAVVGTEAHLVWGSEGWDGPFQGEAEGQGLALTVVDLDGLAEIGVGALIAAGNLPDGLEAAPPDRWLVVSGDGFTGEQLAWMEDHPHVSLTWGPDPWGQDRGEQLVGLAIALGLLLVIGRVAAALVAVETDGDTATMVAIGAPRWARQRLLGAQMGVQVGVAVGLGVLVGLALGWYLIVMTGFDSTWRPFVPLYLVGGLALAPGLVAAVVALTTRSAPAALSRRLT